MRPTQYTAVALLGRPSPPPPPAAAAALAAASDAMCCACITAAVVASISTADITLPSGARIGTMVGVVDGGGGMYPYGSMDSGTGIMPRGAPTGSPPYGSMGDAADMGL